MVVTVCNVYMCSVPLRILQLVTFASYRLHYLDNFKTRILFICTSYNTACCPGPPESWQPYDGKNQGPLMSASLDQIAKKQCLAFLHELFLSCTFAHGHLATCATHTIEGQPLSWHRGHSSASVDRVVWGSPSNADLNQEAGKGEKAAAPAPFCFQLGSSLSNPLGFYSYQNSLGPSTNCSGIWSRFMSNLAHA